MTLPRGSRSRADVPYATARDAAEHAAAHPELHGYPYVVIHCAACTYGTLRPAQRTGQWKCGACAWTGELAGGGS